MDNEERIVIGRDNIGAKEDKNLIIFIWNLKLVFWIIYQF
jgi:hypothetical protein